MSPETDFSGSYSDAQQENCERNDKNCAPINTLIEIIAKDHSLSSLNLEINRPVALYERILKRSQKGTIYNRLMELEHNLSSMSVHGDICASCPWKYML